MALRINESFEGPVGVALDTTNTSATSMRAIGGTSVFEAAHVADGTTSAQFTTTSSTAQAAEWTLATVSVGYFSFYFSPQQVTTGLNILVVGTFTTSMTAACSVGYDPAGKIRVNNQSGAVMGSVTTDSAVLNELNRVDVSFNAGTVHMEFYPGNATASNAAGTATAGNSKTGTTTQTSYNYRVLGHYGPATLVSNFDAFRESDTALPGPVGAVVATPTPLVAAVAETDTLSAALVSAGVVSTALAGAITETDVVAGVLGTSAAAGTGTITAGLHLDTSNAAASATMTLTAPSDVVTGALMWVQLSLGTLIRAAPAGWTQTAASLVTSAPRLYAYAKVATASDVPGTTYAWTYNSATGSASIQTYFGVDTTTSTDAAATTAGSATAATSFPIAGAVTVTAGAWLITGVATASTTTTPVLTPPAGFTTRFDNVPKRHSLADRVQAAAGDPGVLTWTVDRASAWTAYATALRPAVVAAVPTALTGAPVESDTLTAALVSVDAAVPTALAAATLETDTLGATLRSSTSLAGALTETNTLGAVLVSAMALTAAAVETDQLAAGLVTSTRLAGALLEGDTVGAALGTSTALTGAVISGDTLTVVLVTSTALTAALLEADLLGAALSTPLALTAALTETDLLAGVLATGTALGAALLEVDTITGQLTTGTQLAAALLETDAIAVVLGTSTALAAGVSESDGLAGALATVTALTAAILDVDTVIAALSMGTALAAALIETDTGTATLGTSTQLAGAPAETDTLTATLITSTRVAAALVDADTIGVVLGTTTGVTAALLDTDTLSIALVSPTSLAVTLLEMATLTVALSTQGALVTLAVVPTFGTIPFTVTATATAYASPGAVLSYAFAWGDGGTTAPNASASATHSYVSSGIYSPVCTVSSSSVGGTLAATTTELDTLTGALSSAVLLAGALRETDMPVVVPRSAMLLAGASTERDTVAAVLVSATAAPAIAFGWQLTPTNTGLSGAGIDRTTLPTYSGGTPVAGQTITLQKITSSWDLAGWNGGSDNGPQIANVTFDRCWFSVPLDRCGQFGPNNLLVDCDIVGPGTSPNAYGPLVSGGVTTAAIFRRCLIDNFTISLWLDGAATVDYCYLTARTDNAAAHVDGVTRRGSTLPLIITRSYIRAKGIAVTGALFVTGDWALNPSGVNVSDSLFESDGVDCLALGNNNVGGTSSYAFSNCRAIGTTIVDRNGAGTCVSNPFTVWIYDVNNAFNSTDGGRKGASVPF